MLVSSIKEFGTGIGIPASLFLDHLLTSAESAEMLATAVRPIAKFVDAVRKNRAWLVSIFEATSHSTVAGEDMLKALLEFLPPPVISSDVDDD